jgi:spore germination cell wall hydrolase CwlJ-like protein
MKDILLSIVMLLSPTEFNCLAQNVYYEARNQPIEGQLAVADVTLNRVEDERWPDTICGVVEQKNQFSWVGNVHEKPKGKAWRRAKEVALLSLFSSNRIRATHFHATYVSPEWAHKKQKVKKIKDHIFYA